MSHHFDTPTAREDPRLNVCDYYLFRRRPGTVVVAMTVNPDAGLSAPDTFRGEGLYAFRFDTNGDGVEDVTFKIRFGEVAHRQGSDHQHTQEFEVRRASGDAARAGADGELLIKGRTGENTSVGEITVYAGLAPDLFAGDAIALGVFRAALVNENRFASEAWLNRKNFFDRRNVTAIVLELPLALLGEGMVYGWATASLYGHAPEIQVSRWGLPLITNIFIPDETIRETYNRTGPATDIESVAPAIAEFAARTSGIAGSTANPGLYGHRLARRLCPIMLPYELDSDASFDYSGFNGRSLTDDVMDVMLTLAGNAALSDGVAPDQSRIQAAFPYFSRPFAAEEQLGITAARKPAKDGEKRQ
jgi:hypothetical protein